MNCEITCCFEIITLLLRLSISAKLNVLICEIHGNMWCWIVTLWDVDLGIIWFVAYGEEKWLCLLFWFQGLVYNGNDTLFESTGLYGKVILLIFSSIAFFFCYFKWFSLALCIPFFHYTVGVGWEILCIFEL